MNDAFGTAFSAPLEISIGDEVLKFTEPRMVDFGWYESWMQAKAMNILLSGLEDLPDDVRDRAIARAQKIAPKVGLSVFAAKVEGVEPADHVALSETIKSSNEGIVRHVLMHLRQHQPEMTVESLVTLINQPGYFAAMSAAIEQLQARGRSAIEQSGGGGAKKKDGATQGN